MQFSLAPLAAPWLSAAAGARHCTRTTIERRPFLSRERARALLGTFEAESARECVQTMISKVGPALARRLGPLCALGPAHFRRKLAPLRRWLHIPTQPARCLRKATWARAQPIGSVGLIGRFPVASCGPAARPHGAPTRAHLIVSLALAGRAPVARGLHPRTRFGPRSVV